MRVCGAQNKNYLLLAAEIVIVVVGSSGLCVGRNLVLGRDEVGLVFPIVVARLLLLWRHGV